MQVKNYCFSIISPVGYRIFLNGCLFLLLLLLAPTARGQFVRGADIGWLQQMEATGYKFYDSAGVERECLDILKSRGINTVRLRVFVNPSDSKTDGHCSKKEVAMMAVRAKNKGMRLMIDFHYSDSWADPGKQNKPAAWAQHPFSQLLNDLYDHTFEVLDTLRSIGATPDWVQVGNEITWGMLWPDGKTDNWPQLAQLLNKGYDATKAVDSSIKVIVHIDQGNNNFRFRTFFDNARNYKVRYDIIGASYYPYWLGSDYTATISNLAGNLNDMVTRYDKDVMVVEVGGDYQKIQNTYDMLVAVIKKTSEVTAGRGLGVIYWEPEGEKSWSGYQLSCWGPDHKPTKALNAFLTPVSGIQTPGADISFNIFRDSSGNGNITVELKGLTGSATLQVFDINGKLLCELPVSDGVPTALNTDLPRGTCIFTVQHPKGKLTRKFLVE